MLTTEVGSRCTFRKDGIRTRRKGQASHCHWRGYNCRSRGRAYLLRRSLSARNNFQARRNRPVKRASISHQFLYYIDDKPNHGRYRLGIPPVRAPHRSRIAPNNLQFPHNILTYPHLSRSTRIASRRIVPGVPGSARFTQFLLSHSFPQYPDR
jgi:hypothetical protein